MIVDLHTLNEESYARHKQYWEGKNDVGITFSLREDADAEKIVAFLLSHLPDDFAITILSDFVEHESISTKVLSLILDKEIRSCSVSICLRNDLPQELLQRCLRTSDVDVLEHAVFNNRVTVSDCEKLLSTPMGQQAKKAIERAIQLKGK